MSIIVRILKRVVKLPDIESFDSFLFIGPHPDDIEIGAGATAAKLAAAGKEVHYLIATDGRYGGGEINFSVSPDELAEIRKNETIAAADYLGVKSVKFLGYSDGGFYDPVELKNSIARAICGIKPDVVLAPDPDLTSEHHEDHLNTGRAAKAAAIMVGNKQVMKNIGCGETAQLKAVAYYYTAKPNKYVGITKFQEKKFNAVFEHHLSQFPKENPENIKLLKLYLNIRAFRYGIKAFSKKAEAFRVFAPIHMHCCPEAEEM